MNAILQFLKDQIDSVSEDFERLDVTKKDIETLRNLFVNRSEHVNHLRHLKRKPHIERNQIWTVKTEYDDFQGICQKTSHPFIVLTNSEQQQLEGEDFVRVFVISPFIEIASGKDGVCHDSSIIGFPFLIELWNNQPVLTELLDEYVGYYELKSILNSKKEVFELVNESNAQDSSLGSEELTVEQQEFRTIEISRAKYINHSVLSLLSFLENRQTEDAGVVISMFNEIQYPKFYTDQTEKEPILTLAAKSGLDSDDKYLLYENQNLPFQVFFKKNDDGFIISVQTTDKVKLLNNRNEELICISNKEKSVFASLKEGKYTLIFENIKEPLKIILK